jgi:hypothetical protein
MGIGKAMCKVEAGSSQGCSGDVREMHDEKASNAIRLQEKWCLCVLTSKTGRKSGSVRDASDVPVGNELWNDVEEKKMKTSKRKI